jgi:uncharacterized membrane protein YkvA (DUF1232 family)
MQRAWHDWFRREKRKAKRLIQDPAAVLRAVMKAGQKADRLDKARGPLGRVWDDLRTSVRLVRAWGRRDYPGVGLGTIALIVGALLYFVSPIDAIVDAIPVLGYVDDAAVLAWVFGQVRAELDTFRSWETKAIEAGPADDARSDLVISPKL